MGEVAGPCKPLSSSLSFLSYLLRPNQGKHKHTPRRGHKRPSWDVPPALLLVLHVTPIRGVLSHKKGLELRLNLLFEDRTLLIGVHGLKRFPETHGKAAVRIVDILGKPAAPQTVDLFARHGRPIGLFIFLPTACPQFPPRNPHNHDRSSCDCTRPAARESSVMPLMPADLTLPLSRFPLPLTAHT